MTNPIEKARVQGQANNSANQEISIGEYLPEVNKTVARLEQDNITTRIWEKDHTIWNNNPEEISNRLGWLKATEFMADKMPALLEFAEEVKATGIRQVILIGMGGSSLGPEVLRQSLGTTPGYPVLTLLDSTLPEAVLAAAKTIDMSRALFVISSKSGTTLETRLLMEYFKGQVAATVGEDKAGQHFVAITDAGTPLNKLAEEQGFRRVFLNPSDIGGRYSVLSYFGMVPAALAGIDIEKIISQADIMKTACGITSSVTENPGAWLGALLGTMTRRGRDKLTLLTSPSISSFGLWVEQILAESTGKQGKGIVPIAGEPLAAPQHYGKDRLFIYLRLKGDDNSALDQSFADIKASGQPDIVLNIPDKYDLGAEFFRWEFANAVAGAILEINPFDQPDVKGAKETSVACLKESGAICFPPHDTESTFEKLLAKAEPGRYLAILAYLKQSPEFDEAFSKLRQRVVTEKGIATMVGYGPRYLHSTGQLHKGGPGSGLFLMITTDHEQDAPISGRTYGFSRVADAQALGDLRTLISLGRDVIRIHLKQGDVKTISGLSNGL